METTQFDFISEPYSKLRIKFIQVVSTSLALLLPEFGIARVPSKIRTFQIVAHKLKRLTLPDFRMFAASAECLLNNLLTGLFYNKSLWYDPLANDNRSEFELRSC
jgi:hypothetical protein